MTRRAIIVDDEESVCWSLDRALRAEGYETAVAANAEDGLRLVEDRPPDVMFLDVRLPGQDGITALEQMQQLYASVPVVIMTAYGDLTTAVRAMKSGAFDYLVKPFDLSQALRAAANAQHWRGASSVGVTQSTNFDGEIVGQSKVMQEVFHRIALVAPHSASVLITGESGVGKELVARAIHRHSGRSAGPFVPVTVSALNPTLLESELFGHVQGTVPGAEIPRIGILAQARGGTVFLDEVTDVPLPVQAKLLRALELGEVIPHGGYQPTTHDFRVIAASSRNLQQLVEEGLFRQDLYYRLNVFRIHVPPLRDRLEDVPTLAEYFLRQFHANGMPIPAETLEFLRKQPWPGNVGEFRNALERASIIAHGSPLMPEHFGEPNATTSHFGIDIASAVRQWLRQRMSEGSTVGDLMAELMPLVESALIAEVLRHTHGNRSLTAQWLGLDRATVRKKIQQYDLENESSK